MTISYAYNKSSEITCPKGMKPGEKTIPKDGKEHTERGILHNTSFTERTTTDNARTNERETKNQKEIP